MNAHDSYHRKRRVGRSRATEAEAAMVRPSRGNLRTLVACLPLLCILVIATSRTLSLDQPQQVTYFDSSSGSPLSVLPPPQVRPNVRVNLQDWARRLSEEIHSVEDKTNCPRRIASIFSEGSEFSQLDVTKVRDSILSQINGLLSQHKNAVNNIVGEAEKLVLLHNYNKNLRVNYTDVHRLRNELEPPDNSSSWNENWGTSSAASGGSGASASTGTGGGAQSSSISGGTPVPGPSEWQTPVKSIVMQLNKNFGDIPVNTSMSAIHLPLPIYAGLPDIMNGIAWTERLDQVYKRNLLTFAHVHHQVYGDHLGFLRTFPAHKWRIPRSDPDLFDARVRPWYVAGASMPKDVVILVDTSGSMTGLRREIAKGVVFEILDTLTNIDHFAVLRFSESVTPIGFPKCNLRTPKMGPALEEQCQAPADMREHHECSVFRRNWDLRGQYLRDGKNGSYLSDDAYKKSVVNVTSEIKDAYLLPATSRNIRYLKSNFSMPTAGIANFTHALMAGFELLNAYNRTVELGSHCNQAIMLITDGAIRSHDEIFHRLNYPNSPVRVFTYMIGREVGDITHTKAMACNNRGYYTHVINLGEVREQVQKYLPVMARPLVLMNSHPVTWTHVYGDETYQVLTDWVLELKRRERARIMLNEERDRQTANDFIFIESTNIPEYDELSLVGEELKNRIICEDATDNDPAALDESLGYELDPLGYNELSCHWASRRADLLISVVMPVFDPRNTSRIFERVLHKNIWIERETNQTNAQLLGVAAVDLRVADLLHAAPSHLLGPNGYAIVVGQNGFVLHHPDFRALLEDPFDKQSKILKPHFASVDLTHIEQVYYRAPANESEPVRRKSEDKVLKMRESTLKRQSGTETFYIKRAVDCRRRLLIRQQTFHYGPIKDTPFSFILALPQAYGTNRVTAKQELSSDSKKYFEPSPYELWTVHPEYRYCKGTALSKNSSVAAILDVLEAARSGSASQVAYDDLSALMSDTKRPKLMVCDRELFPALLFDAAATYEQSAKPSTSFYGSSADATCSSDEQRSMLASIHGLEMSFVATRSGLTRVRVFDLTPRIKKLADLFVQRHNKAIDEPWYSRTVDWNMKFQEDATIITAPFNAYVRLIAKLRQRITQRHQAINDTKANCDPRLGEEHSGDVNNSTDSPSDSSSPIAEPAATQDSSSANSVDKTSAQMQNDDPSTYDHLNDKTAPDFQTDNADQVPEESYQLLQNVNFNEYSTYDFLDLIANSSVHISASRSVIVSKGNRQRQAVAVTGLLYDYATFARRFLNATSLNIQVFESTESGPNLNDLNGQSLPPVKIDICPNGDCPTKCGLRNDSIDCLLVDNNGYIVVGEELSHIGRSLLDYDERLMQSLVDRHVFHPVTMIDYQAICSKTPAEVGAPSGPGASMASVANSMAQAGSSLNSGFSITRDSLSFQVANSVLSNLVAAGTYIWSTMFTLMLYQSSLGDLHYMEKKLNNFLDGFQMNEPHSGHHSSKNDLPSIGEHLHWQRSAIQLADAQSAISNMSLLALLPNKTYLRPCEKTITLYETRPIDLSKLSSESPEYYVTRCGCSSWYVHEAIPKTNLIMIVVNTTSSCRRCDTSSNFVPVVVAPESVSSTPTAVGQASQPYNSNKTNEDAVCTMLEREAQLYVKRLESCISYHPGEAQIQICGAAHRSVTPNGKWVLLVVFASLTTMLFTRIPDTNRNLLL